MVRENSGVSLYVSDSLSMCVFCVREKVEREREREGKKGLRYQLKKEISRQSP